MAKRLVLRVVLRALVVCCALASCGVRAAEDDSHLNRRRLVDVTGSAFFDVFGFELTAAAAFDPICEFLNPFLRPEYRLSACEIAAEDESGGAEYEFPEAGVVPGVVPGSVVPGSVVLGGSFGGGFSGNAAQGIGGAAIGGVAGGSGAALGSLGLGGVGR
jgi:hypothetical protein